ncbi:acyl-CoA ligase (AMP-forming), exosortase A system-associated [Aestuariicella hydrocarbonica]|uniref:Acyl-CoA ligase (AMP-forming), exosortase A system-associated n=1 Tax=Pseudomaricurvus hydrocarbonicus TaxID=1470433 RepID=A0A9E5JU85_9GAMM|nr:acyl-CoA ligase (AMP-forming), exosortase A system-associated [Aestuariicella hydrocarbonica]NHO64665.1 acyl-CoA ligase (AMP-forming), exosortase A system-associated [Aestuariicella hydrocarbonica]
MPVLLHELIQNQLSAPDRTALVHGDHRWSYSELYGLIEQVAAGFSAAGLSRGQRVAVYLPKQIETVVSFFAASLCGAVFVPINPLLKPPQVAHIIRDCHARLLVTSTDRWSQVQSAVVDCESLTCTVLTGLKEPPPASSPATGTLSWEQLVPDPSSPPAASPRATGSGTHGLANNGSKPTHHPGLDSDIAAILYTSGSTGQPKGVVLSHRNMMVGAESVSTYLRNTAEDRLLAVLPFSFDYGLSQLTTAFRVGASVVLMDYLLPRDVIRALSRFDITGLAAVPPLWNQLAALEWPQDVSQRLRYITNSGGAMPQATTEKLQSALPHTDIYLMYGLTEAFRSTYLPPDQVAVRPTSMGKAIPNAEILVVREDGSECDANEVGELVHRGPLVSQGYWNDPVKTAERFKPAPNPHPELPFTEIAVWSGDQAYRDDDGFLYFVSRKDEMIKTSGYRVSPTEVEEVLFLSPLIKEAVAIGVPHPDLGQAIVLVASARATPDKDAIVQYCRQHLPNFMIPRDVIFMDNLPRNPNGKIDRKALSQSFESLFTPPAEPRT